MHLLQSIPLFPRVLVPNAGSNTAHGMVSHTDSTLTTMIRFKLSVVWGKGIKDPCLFPYTSGYSLRIGGEK
jgi:hypothetical protein